MGFKHKNKLRIGIDARLLSQSINGIGRYTYETIKQLLNKPGDFFLYSPNPVSYENLNDKNLVIRTANCHSRIEKILWSQTQLPYWIYKDKLDVFWGPTHRLPSFIPSNIAKAVTIHDLVWKHAGQTMKSLNRFAESILMPLAIESSDFIISVSQSTAHDIAAAYPKASKKICVIYPGHTSFPNADNNVILTKLQIPSPYILFVGTLEPRKNLHRLIKAFSSLGEENKSISLVIAGGKGWGDVHINKWIDEYDLNGKVFPVGYVTNQQLTALYANSLFLAMPSLYEGFGLPIIEAMSFGKPVLTSNISCMPEIAGEAAILVNPLDEQSITTGLRCLLDKNTRDKLAAKAKQNADRFKWEECADQIWNVFQKAVNIKKKGRLTPNKIQDGF